MRLPSRAMLLELFTTSNLAFLAVDVSLAHSANAFRAPLEWVPVAASIALAVGLALALSLRWQWRTGAGWMVGVLAGSVALAVGIAGMVLHLESQFFQTLTLRGLVYSAPFVAPLAYAGLGFLVLLNRLVPADAPEWGEWVLLLALGGFLGNFVLSLADHAQNGFFNALEWIPVAVAALAVGFFAVAAVSPRGRPLLLSLWIVLVLQATTGVLGFGLHLRHLTDPTITSLRDRVLYGAPPFAPLLFADLALLGALAVWDLREKGFFGEGERVLAEEV